MYKCNVCGLIAPCPACHPYARAKIDHCVDCGTPVMGGSTRCRSCQAKYAATVSLNYAPKIEWPPIDRLEEMVQVVGYLETGRRLGVSNTAVWKHMQRYGTKVDVLA